MIVTINSGSSSIKFTVFPAGREVQGRMVLCHGQIEGLGEEPKVVAVDSAGRQIANQQLKPGASHENALELLLRRLEHNFEGQPVLGAGHRVARRD
jgi:acetate kinase